jgi:hypothetical protein
LEHVAKFLRAELRKQPGPEKIRQFDHRPVPYVTRLSMIEAVHQFSAIAFDGF